MTIPPEFLDELRLRLPLSDVVGRRVRLERAGREKRGLCPFHKEKTPSFYVNDERQSFNCFGCGAGGDVITFVMQADGLSFPEAVEKLADMAGLTMPARDPGAERRLARQRSLHDVLEQACAWYEARLGARDGEAARAYLGRRGLAPETVAAARIGYAPSGPGALMAALTASGVPREMLAAAGLVTSPEGDRGPVDMLRARVVLPITDRQGRVVGFGGRALDDRQPKYLNTPETELFRKGSLLYGLAEARQAAARGAVVIAVEGYMDVLSLRQAGFAAAVAPLGTAMTESQLEALWRLSDEPVLCFDGDSAGQRAALRAIERALPLLAAGRSLRFATLPAGQDPDDLVRSGGAPAVAAVLERSRPLVDMLWESHVASHPYDTPERAAGFESRLMGTVGRIADAAVQQHYRRAMGERVAALFGGAASRPARAGAGVTRAPFARGGRLTAGESAALWRRQVNAGRVEAEIAGIRPRRDALTEGRRRREEAMLCAVLLDPAFGFDVIEELGAIPVTDPELDRLRQGMVDVLAESEALDSEALRRHLGSVGLGGAVDRLLGERATRHETVNGDALSTVEMRSRWRRDCEVLRREMLQEQLEAAQEAHAAMPESDEALARVEAISGAIQEAYRRQAELDD